MSLVVIQTSCRMGDQCKNSVETVGEERARCIFCRLSPVNEGRGQTYWKPIDKKVEHPVLKHEKAEQAKAKVKARQEARRNKDKGRQRVLRQAERAERTTERKLIKATKNSGRSHRDGDHVAAGRITLDTKHQSQRDNPVVNLNELFKVQMDAIAAGNLFGALVLRPRSNQGVVVMAEADFAKLLKLIEKQETSNEQPAFLP